MSPWGAHEEPSSPTLSDFFQHLAAEGDFDATPLLVGSFSPGQEGHPFTKPCTKPLAHPWAAPPGERVSCYEPSSVAGPAAVQGYAACSRGSFLSGCSTESCSSILAGRPLQTFEVGLQPASDVQDATGYCQWRWDGAGACSSAGQHGTTYLPDVLTDQMRVLSATTGIHCPLQASNVVLEALGSSRVDSLQRFVVPHPDMTAAPPACAGMVHPAAAGGGQHGTQDPAAWAVCSARSSMRPLRLPTLLPLAMVQEETAAASTHAVIGAAQAARPGAGPAAPQQAPAAAGCAGTSIPAYRQQEWWGLCTAAGAEAAGFTSVGFSPILASSAPAGPPAAKPLMRSSNSCRPSAQALLQPQHQPYLVSNSQPHDAAAAVAVAGPAACSAGLGPELCAPLDISLVAAAAAGAHAAAAPVSQQQLSATVSRSLSEDGTQLFSLEGDGTACGAVTEAAAVSAQRGSTPGARAAGAKRSRQAVGSRKRRSKGAAGAVAAAASSGRKGEASRASKQAQELQDVREQVS